MDNARERLMALLTEMFQLDQADLDFGIFRVMNHKREEVGAFLRHELLPTIEQAFKTNLFADHARTEEAIKKAKLAAFEAGFDASESPRVKELQAQLKQMQNPKALEAEVCSDLVTFFSRYYESGDFISRRRYKDDVYAIPYQGEEVKLHWANHDQYYIKSSERLSRYAFTLPTTARRVRFEVVAGATEKDNAKATRERERRFVLADPPWEIDGAELVLRFAYRIQAGASGEATEAEEEGDEAAKKKAAPPQAECNNTTVKAVRAGAKSLGDRAAELLGPAPTEKRAERTVLERHLERFTKRNDFDYFIHKNLDGFLRRELDVFIKNEIFHLDDIERQGALRVEQALSRVRVLREVAHKLIDFLGQLEEFQKSLWLKKKFVYETSWCVTLDRVPEALWPEVLANDRQREAWVKLFAIDRIEKNLAQEGGAGALTTEFLRQNPSLVVDTALFSADFTARLVASIDDLDASTAGVLIHGENFQALNLMQARYRGKVKCIYIDPPYNTGGDGFAYKDGYQHSSWLAMMADRIRLSGALLDPSGALAISVDAQRRNERHRLNLLVEQSVPGLDELGELVWRTRNTDNRVETNLSIDHEYVVIFAGSEGRIVGRTVDRSNFRNDGDPRGAYTTDPLTGKADAKARPNLHYTMINPTTGDEYLPDPDLGWITDPAGFQALLKDARISWPPNPEKGKPRKKRFLSEAAERVPLSSLGVTVKQGEEGNQILVDHFGYKAMTFTKPVVFVDAIVDVCSESHSTVVDFFAGSGTTAHAVLARNSADSGNRRFVLVEMGSHFDTVLKPRVLKVIHSSDWKDGVPVSRKGISAIVKFVRIESYEDALENLAPKRTPVQESLLARATPAFREKYFLQYMLRWETRGQGSMIDGSAFEHPFDRALQVTQGDDVRAVTLDLVETFNWLLGLTVTRMDLRGDMKTVAGRLPTGESALVVWRDVGTVDIDALDAWWKATDWNADPALDVVYVNGPYGIETHRPAGAHWRTKRTETEFLQRMFEADAVAVAG